MDIIRLILKEYDLEDGLTEVVEYFEDGRTYRVISDIIVFKPTVNYCLTKKDWKKVAYITDYTSFYRELCKDDLKYLEDNDC